MEMSLLMTGKNNDGEGTPHRRCDSSNARRQRSGRFSSGMRPFARTGLIGAVSIPFALPMPVFAVVRYLAHTIILASTSP